jgi:tyrosyl-tRNA synthetase
VFRVLKERGLLNDATNEEGLASESKAKKKMAVYCGFDPTADSLHLGNLLGIIVLSWFARAGHQVFALCGGATGLVGDPSGKSAERPMLDVATLNRNTDCIGAQLNKLLTTTTKEEEETNRKGQQSDRVEVLNNLEWFESMTFLDFLRNVGKFARVGTMLNKDSVKSRMESSNGDQQQPQGSGLSFTEFSYQLLQGYDFMHLYRTKNCRIQIGGSDQWGNITAGTDLIRRLCSTNTDGGDLGNEEESSDGKNKDLSLAYGLTFPLLVGSDGKKFGKSEGGAIWLDGGKLSPYHMYQHLLRTPDSDVVKFLKMLTFLDLDKIQDLEDGMDKTPNAAQKVLAAEVTLFVHGEQGLQEALKITEGLFESQKKTDGPPSVEAFEALLVSGNAPTAQLADDEVIGATVVDLLVKVGLQPSKSAVRRMIKGGAIRVNNRLVEDEGETIQKEEVVDNRFLLLAAGKKNKKIVQLGRWID